MKKVALLFTSGFLLSQVFAYDINFSKNFSKKLMPDILSTNLSIRIEGKNEQEISNKLAIFNKEIKENKVLDKKLGSYNVRPNFKYSSNNSPKITGYVGELRYKIESNNAKDINTFITSINTLKKSRSTSISVSGLSWKVKDDTYNVALDILRLESIYWIETYVNNLSKDLNKKCEVKNINISAFNRPVSYAMSRNFQGSEMISDSIPVPQANNQKISIHPIYKVDCK